MIWFRKFVIQDDLRNSKIKFFLFERLSQLVVCIRYLSCYCSDVYRFSETTKVPKPFSGHHDDGNPTSILILTLKTVSTFTKKKATSPYIPVVTELLTKRLKRFVSNSNFCLFLLNPCRQKGKEK